MDEQPSRTSKDIEKRKKAFDVNIVERAKIIKVYDASLARKIQNLTR